MALADLDLAAVGLDDAPGVKYVAPSGPALLAGPPTVVGEMGKLEALPTVRSKWLDKFIFLGTGTSGQVPAIQCLTHASAPAPGEVRKYSPCAACHDVLLNGHLSRNRRTCTAAVVVGGPKHAEGPGRKEDQATILIDCGPTFYQEAYKAWAAHDLRGIDAVLLTHGHADAVLGLDHLRAWTIGKSVQSHVDVYLSQTTYDVVSSMFPYLADPRKATGGGGVGQLRWHIIDPQQPSFTISPPGKSPVEVVPLPVAHGLAPGGGKFEFVGWRVGELSYVSDCSEIPPATAARMQGSEVLVIDALKWNRHLSHYSIDQALQFSLQLANPARPCTSHSGTEQGKSESPQPNSALSIDRANPLKLVFLTDLTHHIEHWTLTQQLAQWEGDMRLIAHVADARVKRVERDQGPEAAAELRDEMVRACPDVHHPGATPPVARGPYRDTSSQNIPNGSLPKKAKDCWWHPYWEENESEQRSLLETKLVVSSVREQVQHLLDQDKAALQANATTPSFHIPAFRVAYDQQAITFK